ncbi:MAG: Hsp20/alpha crystallin family protein [Nitrososphaera sp.]|jgi:HSP20 family protein
MHDTVFLVLIYSKNMFSHMTTSEKTGISKRDEDRFAALRRLDSIFDNFRQEVERALMRPWSSPFDWNFEFPSLFENRAITDTRMALCDMVDKGDHYELSVEVPGIEKEKIDVKATKHSVEITGEQKEKTEEKAKNYVYNERSYRSFNRRVPMPEEIVPSKIEAKMSNGILNIKLPKKTPTKMEEESTKVEVK